MGRTTLGLVGLLVAALAVGGTASAQLGGGFGDGLGDRDVEDLLSERRIDGDCLGGDLFPGDFSLSERTRIERSQDVDLDEDDVFLAIALDDGDLRDVRSIGAREEVSIERTRSGDLDEDAVFSLLALDSGTSVDADCLGDVSETVSRTTTVGRDVDLEEDDVFLGLAFGDGVGFTDLADIDLVFERDLDVDRDFDLDREDALLSLVFDDGGF